MLNQYQEGAQCVKHSDLSYFTMVVLMDVLWMYYGGDEHIHLQMCDDGIVNVWLETVAKFLQCFLFDWQQPLNQHLENLLVLVCDLNPEVVLNVCVDSAREIREKGIICRA